MTSKELNEILNKTRRTKDISLTPEQVEELVKKLEVLEILTNNEVDIERFKIAFIEFEDDYWDYYYNYTKYSIYNMSKEEFNLLIDYLKKIEEE